MAKTALSGTYAWRGDLSLVENVFSPEDPDINPLNAELNPICYLLALLGAHHFHHVSRIWVKYLYEKEPACSGKKFWPLRFRYNQFSQ